MSTTKIIVNKEHLDELLRELRMKTPDEIKRYQKIIANRDAILAALDVYKKNPEEWKNLTAKGMRKNYSWKASSRKYEKLYSDL